MTEQEARELKVGDRIVLTEGSEDFGGAVIATNQYCIEIHYDDGLPGYISPLDCGHIRRDFESQRAD